MASSRELSADANELILYAENEEKFYNQYKAIILNLARKMARERYNHARAPLLWKYWVDAAARAYKREYGTADWSFSVAARKEAAAYLADQELEDIEAAAAEINAGKRPWQAD